MLLALAMLIFALTAYAESRKQVNTTTVANLDLQKYMGRWYEIARLDNSFERGMTDVVAEYTLLDDGTIRIVNSGMKDGKYHQSEGRGKVTSQTGRLRVSFFMFFYSDYNILAMSPDGQWVLVAHFAWCARHCHVDLLIFQAELHRLCLQRLFFKCDQFHH